MRQAAREAAAMLKDAFSSAWTNTTDGFALQSAALELAEELAHRADQPDRRCHCDGCEFRREVIQYGISGGLLC